MKTDTETETCSDTVTPFDNFKEAVRHIMSVPKKEIDRREAEYQKNKPQKKKKQPTS